ncbi:MAG: NADPH dehydrogenase NamA [Tissierellales bacterium]|nr:NADPH dehydrogenase NamA [Tissierellales bacterium]MBN2827166.1 NADPH dehydrogenase NamA [Tissierellales bacterium]
MKKLKSFEPYTLKNLTLKNRIIMPPMCMYSSTDAGLVGDFHAIHYNTRAIGGVSLIIIEATGVMPNGRISDRDLGLWNQSQGDSMQALVQQIKSHGAAVGIQLNHGGRKYNGKEKLVAPSPIAFNEDSLVPEELSVEEISNIIDAFARSAQLAHEADIDMLEIHGAHGYLINQFLSPHSNKRTDHYGGSQENRLRFLKEILESIKNVWPNDKAISLRISATEHLKDGYQLKDMIEMLNQVRDSIDIVHVSTSGNGPWNINAFPGYQIKEAEAIRQACKIPTIAVGHIDNIPMIEEILGNERADLIALGRELLRNPYFPINQAAKYGINIDIPKQYERAFM